MKKIIALILVAVCLFSFSACGESQKNESPLTPKEDIHYVPNDGIFDAPREFYLDWDIPSERDGSLETGRYDYSMPVYRFDTYEELLHLKEIVGEEYIGNEKPASIWFDHTEYTEYDAKFFEEYSLLIGWCDLTDTYIQTEFTVDGYLHQNTPSYYIDNNTGALTARVNDAYRREGFRIPQWIFVAVPKTEIEKCTSISFLLNLQYVVEE